MARARREREAIITSKPQGASPRGRERKASRSAHERAGGQRPWMRVAIFCCLCMSCAFAFGLGRGFLASSALMRGPVPRLEAVRMAGGRRPVHGIAELSSMTAAQLRDELVKRGLPKSGNKAAMVERLTEQMRPPSNGIAKRGGGKGP